MDNHEDDEIYDDFKDTEPKRSKPTKFREFDKKGGKSAKRNKPHNKRSHHQKTIKDDYWPDE